MNRIAAFIAFYLATALFPTVMTAQDGAAKPKNASQKTFQIDPGHSMALFRVQHLGASMFHGRFNDVLGQIVLDASAESPISLEVKIPIASVHTGSDRLDGHLKNADFFDAEKHPEMTFKSKSSKKSGENAYEVNGDITIRGVTKEITVTLEQIGMKDAGRGLKCGFEAVFKIKRSEFGMMYGVEKGALGDETRVTVAIEAGVVSEEGSRGGRRGGGMKDRLLSFDKNKDGKIEKGELPERMQRMFGRFDANGDGVIDATELDNLPTRGGRGGR